MNKNLSKEDKICKFLLIILGILISIITYKFIEFNKDYTPPIYEEIEREPFRYEIKDLEIFVEDVVRVRNSNVFKEDKYYVQTNGENSYNKLYITEEIYNYLANNLKEPSIVNFECKVMNGYLEGTTYNDYVIEILNISN